jgi:uncharacterized membrane protein YfcA
VDSVFTLLCLAAFAAGALDATVGGGGFLLIPAMVFSGTPIAAAIGTSRVVFFLDSFSGFIGHARRGNVDYRIGLTYCALSLVGAQVGAAVTASVSGELMEKAFGFFMLAVLTVFALKPKAGLCDMRERRPSWRNIPAGFFIGFMMGLFGVGVGVLLMLSLVLVSGTSILLASGTQQLIVWLTNVSAILAYGRY